MIINLTSNEVINTLLVSTYDTNVFEPIDETLEVYKNKTNLFYKPRVVLLILNPNNYQLLSTMVKSGGKFGIDNGSESIGYNNIKNIFITNQTFDSYEPILNRYFWHNENPQGLFVDTNDEDLFLEWTLQN